MSDYKYIKNRLDEVLLLSSEVLSDSQIEFIHSYVQAGEWGLAVETLCDIFSEDEVPISAKMYDLIQEAGSFAGLEKDIWASLETQVVKISGSKLVD